MKFALIRPVKREEQDGELYKMPKLLAMFMYKLIIVHRYKQCGMTFRKAFYKKSKEGKAGFYNLKFSGQSLL